MHDIKFKMPFTLKQTHIPPKSSFVFQSLTYEILKQRKVKNTYAWLNLQISLRYIIYVHTHFGMLLKLNIRCMIVIDQEYSNNNLI